MSLRDVIMGIAAAALLSGCADTTSTQTSQEPSRVPQQSSTSAGHVPLGLLGYKLGTPLIVEGERCSDAKANHSDMEIRKVADRELKEPVKLWVSNMDELPKGKHLVLYGYELGAMIGQPVNVFDLRDPMSVSDWQFFHYFVVEKVLDPFGVEISPAGTSAAQ